MNPITFEYCINYKIIDNNGKMITDDSVLEEQCQRGIAIVDYIEDYLHDIISGDIIPPGCELYDIDRDSHHIDHVIYRYDIIGNENNTIDMNELLLSYLRQQINVVYNIGGNYRMIITSIYGKEPDQD
jgi:hypothetical protein